MSYARSYAFYAKVNLEEMVFPGGCEPVALSRGSQVKVPCPCDSIKTWINLETWYKRMFGNETSIFRIEQDVFEKYCFS